MTELRWVGEGNRFLVSPWFYTTIWSTTPFVFRIHASVVQPQFRGLGLGLGFMVYEVNGVSFDRVGCEIYKAF